MSARYFIDTNVFIYHLEALDEHKFAVAERIIREGVEVNSPASTFRLCKNASTPSFAKLKSRSI